MRLVELNEGDKIALEVIYHGNNYEFATNVLGKIQNFILTDAVRSDNDKVLGFNGQDIRVNLIYYRQDRPPIVWKGIGCTLVEYKGKMQYKVVASGEGFELNRRNAFRLFIGNEGVVQMGLNSKAVEVIIKDVSETGFAFVSENDIENSEEMAVRAVFSDNDKSMTLLGNIVRKEVVEDNKILYGCRLSAPNQPLNRYINEKQRRKLANSRGVNLLNHKGNNPLDNKYNKANVLDSKAKMGELDKDSRRKFFNANHHGRKV